MTNSKHSSPPEVVMALWKDALHKAEIIEKRQATEAGKVEYYVHYVGFDHRLDEWIPADRIITQSAVNKENVHIETAARSEKSALVVTDNTSEKLEPELPRRSSKRVSKRKRDDFEGNHVQPSTPISPHLNYNTSPHPDVGQAPPSLDTFSVLNLSLDQKETTKVRNVEMIHFGKYEISPWYYSPYPDEYINEEKRMIVCEYCLKYMKTDAGVRAHRMNCRSKKPPGRVIYAKDTLKIYEVDGKENKLYCQNLCLVAKLFLDHKTLYYDIEGFWFYILTEADERERNVDHIVGYFSKEKISYENYNLACILIFPPYQRKGYGRLLIEFSYEISKHQGKIGSPEQPISDLGLRGYQSFWSSALFGVLRAYRGALTIHQLSQMTAIREEDITTTLDRLGLLKYWQKSKSGQREICITGEMVKEAIKSNRVKLERMVDVDSIRWHDEVEELGGPKAKVDTPGSSSLKRK